MLRKLIPLFLLISFLPFSPSLSSAQSGHGGGGVTPIPPIVAGDCVKWLSSTTVGDTGSPCGSGGGGGTPGGASSTIQWNNAAAFGGISDWVTNGTTSITGSASAILDLHSAASFFLPGSLATGCVTVTTSTGVTSSTPCPANTTAVSHNFLTAFTSATGLFTLSQPAFTDISGSATLAQLPGSGVTTVNGTNCTIGSSCNVSGGPPLGSAAQVPVMNAGATAYAPVTLTQDCSISSSGVVTCTKTNNVAFAPSATTDTTNASNIISGTISAARVPTLNQNTTGQAGTALALAATPTPCGSGQAAQGVLANGNSTGCFTPAGSGTVNTGTQYATAYYPAASTAVSPIANGKTGQVYGSTNGAAPSFLSAGVLGRAVVSGSTDSIACDSSTAIVDRATTVILATGSTLTETIPDASTSGCGAGFTFNLSLANWQVGATAYTATTTATVNNTSASKFFVIDGNTVSPAATTFSLSAGQQATVNSPDGTNYLVRITKGGTTVANTQGYPVIGGSATPNAVPTALDTSSFNASSDRCLIAHTAYAGGGQSIHSVQAPEIDMRGELVNESTTLLTCASNLPPVISAFGGSDPDAGGKFLLPMGALYIQSTQQLGAGHVALEGVVRGQRDASSHAQGSMIVPNVGNWSSGSGSTYSPFAFSFGFLAGQINSTAWNANPAMYDSSLSNETIYLCGTPGNSCGATFPVGGISDYAGEESVTVNDVDIFNPWNAGVDFGAQGPLVQNSSFLKRVRIGWPIAASIPVNTNANSVSSWSATGGSGIDVVTVTINCPSSPCIAPVIGQTSRTLGAAVGTSHSVNINGIHRVCATSLGADDQRCTITSANQYQFIINGATSDSASSGGTAEFYPVGANINGTPLREVVDDITIGGNISAWATVTNGVHGGPYFSLSIDGLGGVVKNVHCEQATDCIGLGFNAPTHGWSFHMIAPTHNLINGFHISNNFPVTAINIYNDMQNAPAALVVTNFLTDDQNGCQITSANNWSTTNIGSGSPAGIQGGSVEYHLDNVGAPWTTANPVDLLTASAPSGYTSCGLPGVGIWDFYNGVWEQIVQGAVVYSENAGSITTKNLVASNSLSAAGITNLQGSCRAQNYTAGGTVAAYTLVVVNTSGQWVTAGTSGGGTYGVAQAAATIGNPVPVCIDGYSAILADGNTTLGDILSPSTTTGGLAHDTGLTSRSSISLYAGVTGDVTTACSSSCSTTPTTIVSLEGINRVGREILATNTQFGFTYPATSGSQLLSTVAPAGVAGTWTPCWINTTTTVATPSTCIAGVSVDTQSGASPALTYADRAAIFNTSGATAFTFTAPGTGIINNKYPFVHMNTNTSAITDTISNASSGFPTSVVIPAQVSGHTPSFLWNWNDGTSWFEGWGPPSDGSGHLGCEGTPALTGDVTSSAGNCATTLPVVNSNVGSFTNASITVNAKGQVTAAANGTSGSGAGGAVTSNTSATTALAATNYYFPLSGTYSTLNTTVGSAAAPIGAAAGAASQLYVKLSANTGGSQTLAVTLYDATAAASEAVTCTVGNSASTCSDTTHSYSIPAGHQVAWLVLVTGGTNYSGNITIGAQIGAAAGSFSGNTSVAASAASSVAGAAANAIATADGSGNVQVSSATVGATIGGNNVVQTLCATTSQAAVTLTTLNVLQSIVTCSIPAAIMATGHNFAFDFIVKESTGAGSYNVSYQVTLGNTAGSNVISTVAVGQLSASVFSFGNQCIVTGTNAEACVGPTWTQSGGSPLLIPSSGNASGAPAANTGSTTTLTIWAECTTTACGGATAIIPQFLMVRAE